jgi:hypothetical protein
MTSTPSGKTPDAFPSPTPEARRGLAIARARLGLPTEELGGDRRERAEALAKGLLELRAAVAKGTLA